MSGNGIITAVIVTHNNLPILRYAIGSLLVQSAPPHRIVIIDSGSDDREAVDNLRALSPAIVVQRFENIGFAAANNRALERYARDSDYILLLNPDAVLGPGWIAAARQFLEENGSAGMMSSPLKGMDPSTQQPTGLWDSLGIYRRALRWEDWGQGKPIASLPAPGGVYEPHAICGALMFFRAGLVGSVTGPHGFFDERFFMYKEDMDLSLRVRRAGYRLAMLPGLEAWHCRGWGRNRAKVPYRLKRLSARNDLRLAAKHLPHLLPLQLAKLAYVSWLEPLLERRRVDGSGVVK